MSVRTIRAALVAAERELEAERRETARLRAKLAEHVGLYVEALAKLGAVEAQRDEALRAVETFEALVREEPPPFVAVGVRERPVGL